MQDEFKKIQSKCNCLGPGVGGYKCPYCRFSKEDKIKAKRHARRLLKLQLKIEKEDK